MNEYQEYLVERQAPVMKYSQGSFRNTEDVLYEGSVVVGKLVDKGEKTALELKGGGYINPKRAVMFVGDFAAGKAPKEGFKKKFVLKENYFLKYAVPLGVGVLGYKLAKHKGFGTMGTILTVGLFTVGGRIPYLMYKRNRLK